MPRSDGELGRAQLISTPIRGRWPECGAAKIKQNARKYVRKYVRIKQVQFPARQKNAEKGVVFA